jgi:hypothetical protein
MLAGDVFEHHRTALLSRPAFHRRLFRFGGLSAAIVVAALGFGTSGYHLLGRLPWVDAFLNAAMILTGMGPVDRMETDAAKLFSAVYALFSGLAFVTTIAVLFAPIVHRFFHRLHLDLEDADEATPGPGSHPPRDQA